jgi:hypothetical protein
VLLMFFRNTAYDGEIRTLFGITPPDLTPPSQLGCIENPDKATDNLAFVLVQGGCPTDCRHAQERVTSIPKQQIGNPLDSASTPTGKKADWGIFWADPAGKSDSGIKDESTKFSVWQVFAKDSCHASRILHSLLTKMQDTHKYPHLTGSYQGQIMIGYTYPPAAPKPYRNDCTPGTGIEWIGESLQ